MIARAGSSLWLLGHELRMFFYNLNAKGASTRKMSKSSIAVWCVLTLGLHGIAYAILTVLMRTKTAQSPGMDMLATGVLAVVFTMMLSAALKFCVEALFERGDLDLLLSSPLSSRSIFTVRLAGIVAGVSGIFLMFLAPLANVGVAIGQFHWLAVYPTLISMSAIAASLGMLLTLFLVRSFGVRRTRVVAQVLGALSGAFVFILSQLNSLGLGNYTQGMMQSIAPLLEPGRLLGPDSIAWLPGRAVLGAPLPLLLLCLCAIGGFALTVRSTHRFFVFGLQQSVSALRAAPRPAGAIRFHFGRSLTRTVLVKEWRLILRDPQLISQVALQLLYMLPLGGLLFVRGSSALGSTGAALAFLSAALASSLAWIMVAAEDAPDLLRAAPCGEGRVRRAKMLAATLPPLALLSLPLLWIALSAPLASLIMFILAGSSTLCAPLLVHWLSRPAARGDFKSRGKGQLLSQLFGFLIGISWSVLTYLVMAVVTGAAAPLPMLYGAGAALVLILGLLGLAYALRRRPE